MIVIKSDWLIWLHWRSHWCHWCWLRGSTPDGRPGLPLPGTGDQFQNPKGGKRAVPLHECCAARACFKPGQVNPTWLLPVAGLAQVWCSGSIWPPFLCLFARTERDGEQTFSRCWIDEINWRGHGSVPAAASATLSPIVTENQGRASALPFSSPVIETGQLPITSPTTRPGEWKLYFFFFFHPHK